MFSIVIKRNETEQREREEEENGGGLIQAKRRRVEGSGWCVATPWLG